MKNLFLIYIILTTYMHSFSQKNLITSGVFHWADLPVKKDTQREGRKITEGQTNLLDYLEIHATTQYKGAIPRPPHDQKNIEELLIIKEGKMKVEIGERSAILTKGAVLLISPLEMQTFENIGDGNLSYYVFMLRSKQPMNIERNNQAGGTLLINESDKEFNITAKGGNVKYFDRPTAMMNNFEIHTTRLNQKGPSHTAHTHIDEEILVIVEGEVEMTIDGKSYQAIAGDIIFAESNKIHQVANAGDRPCSYFAIRWK